MYPVLVSLSANYSRHQGRLFTRYSPVRHSTGNPKIPFAFDLHVLSTPPAFVLSQDQTLQFNILNPIAVLQIDSIGFYSTTIKYYRPARLLFSFQRSIRRPAEPGGPNAKTHRVIFNIKHIFRQCQHKMFRTAGFFAGQADQRQTRRDTTGVGHHCQ